MPRSTLEELTLLARAGGESRGSLVRRIVRAHVRRGRARPLPAVRRRSEDVTCAIKLAALHVWLTPEDLSALQELALAADLTVSAYVSGIVDSWLDGRRRAAGRTADTNRPSPR